MKNRILFFFITIYSSLLYSQTDNLVFAIGSNEVCQGEVIQLNLEFDFVFPNTFYNWNRDGNVIFDFNGEGIGGSGSGDAHSFIILSLNEVGNTTISVDVNGITYSQEILVVKTPNAGLSTTTIFNCNLDETINLFNFLDGNPDSGGVWTLNDEVVNDVLNTSSDQVGVYTYTVSGSSTCSDSQAIIVVSDCSSNEDIDNDGVVNSIDLDNDNDGILDIDENLICEEIETNFLFNEGFGEGESTENDNVSNVLTYTDRTPYSSNNNNGEYNIATSNLLYERNYRFNYVGAFWATTESIGHEDASGNVNGRYLMVNILASEFINAPIYTVEDLFLEKGVSYVFKTSFVNLVGFDIPGRVNPNLRIEIVDNKNTIISYLETGDITPNNDVWEEYQIKLSPTVNIENASFRIINLQSSNSNGNDLGIDNIIIEKLECDININDIDNDELPNFLDVDSDGDGVFDTIEAGLDPSLDANNDGVVDGGVDANGVPLFVNGGLTIVDENVNEVPDYLDEDVVLSSVTNILEENSISIYPNPTSDILFINTSVEIETISVFNLQGALIKNKTTIKNQDTYEVNVSNLVSGIYFLKVNNQDNSLKFIVE